MHTLFRQIMHQSRFKTCQFCQVVVSIATDLVACHNGLQVDCVHKQSCVFHFKSLLGECHTSQTILYTQLQYECSRPIWFIYQGKYRLTCAIRLIVAHLN